MKKGQDLILNGEIILSGTVLSDEYAGWYGDDEAVFAPRMVREALMEFTGGVTVRLTSGGGIAFAGEAIRAILAGHPGGCTIIAEGLAASAASLIFMAGTRRMMSAGSLLMIHDPSDITWGTEADMLREAAVLGQMADTYAAVYGAAAGISAEEARTIMKAETWYSAADAVAAGFADDVVAESSKVQVQAAMTLEGARATFASMKSGLRLRLTARNPGAMTAPGASAAAGGIPAVMAHIEEAAMPETTPAAVVAIPAQIPAAIVAAPTMILPEAAVMAERQRSRDIRAMAAPFMASGALTQADVDALIEDGTSAADAGQKFMTRMAAVQSPVTRPGTAHILRDEVDTKLEGMIGALMGSRDGPAAEFAGIKLKSLAMHLSGGHNRFNEADQVRKGMMSTALMNGAQGSGDFAFITSSVMNRTLRDQYDRRAATWQSVSEAPMNAPDFRELLSIRFGGDFLLKKVLENGEYANTVVVDEAEGLKLERRGRAIALTFESVINDDMGALTRIPVEFAIAARLMENGMVWSLIRSNAVLKSDSLALFHVTHKNLGTAAIISAASVGAGRKLMWEQRALAVKDPDDFLAIEPNRLIVPPALEVVALQFVTQTTPALDGSVNPFKASVQVVVVPNLGAAAGGSDISWYLVSSDKPPISTAYLDGYQAPTVQTIDGLNPDVITMSARHIFAAAATEFRGAHKNPGL